VITAASIFTVLNGPGLTGQGWDALGQQGGRFFYTLMLAFAQM
jgi:hypothetical protein